MERRNFLKKTGIGLGMISVPFSLLEAGVNPTTLNFPGDNPDVFNWENVRNAFSPNPDFINLENGYFSPQTKVNYDKFSGYGWELNRNTSKMMRGDLDDEQVATRKALADLSGVSIEEIVVTRNTTESLNIVINGMELNSGDEVIITDQDYPNMINAFRQREKRDGVVVREIKIPLDPKSDQEVVQNFEKAITPRTKVILITHMINLTGQILPCRKIADMAHSYGLEVMVDAAHSFAHVDFKIPDLGADYLGTSLHKWLSAPVGTGMLYIKKEKIEKIWPLMGDVENEVTNIRKFERQGTQPLGTKKAIRDAIDFHLYVGAKRKQDYLRKLTTYWTSEARKLNKIVVNTPEDPSRYAALGNFKLKGSNPGPVSKKIFTDHSIMTVPVQTPSVDGVRVTPHLYINEEQIDKFIFALKTL